MNVEHMNVIKKWIQDHYQELQIRLPPLPPKHEQRIAVAHCWKCLKEAFHVQQCKDIPDIEFNNCMEILRIVYEYAEDPKVESRFPKVKSYRPNTLKDLFV